MAEDFKIPVIDHTSRDFEAIRDDLINLIPFFSEEWTDFNPSDLGIVLLELMAYMADVLHFYVDRQALECFLPSAIKRESVINLLKLIDFELSSAAPASADLTFTTPAVKTFDIVISEKTKVSTTSTPNPIFFETDTEATIFAGDTSVVVGATEGESGEEDVGASNGTAFQQFLMDSVPIIDGTLKVFLNEGTGEEEWEVVDTLFGASSTDKKVTIQRDDEDRITLFFGDSGQGKIPLNAATIRATFRLGGGIIGNVGVGTITTIVDTIIAGGGPITLAVTNLLPASGGEERQSIEDAKIQGPRTLRTLNRAVTREDFKTLSEGFPGVKKARASEKNNIAEITVRIVPGGGGQPSITLKADLKAFLDARRCIGSILIVDGPQAFVNVDIEAVVVVKDNFVRNDVELEIDTAIDVFFSLDSESINFGQTIFASDLCALIDNINGVDHVDFIKLTRRPEARLLTWSGNATFGTIVLGTAAKRETWTVTLTSPTTFTMTGSVSGLQVATGTFGVAYSTDDTELTFTITVGGTPNVAGDTAEIVTSVFNGNVQIADPEFPQKGDIDLTFEGGAASV